MYHVGTSYITGSNKFTDEAMLTLATALNLSVFGRLIVVDEDEETAQNQWLAKMYGKGHFEISTGSQEDNKRVKNTQQQFEGDDVLTLYRRFDLALKLLSEDPGLIDRHQQETLDNPAKYWKQMQGIAMGGGGREKSLSPNQLKAQAKLLHGKLAFVLCSAGTCDSFRVAGLEGWNGPTAVVPDEETLEEVFQARLQADANRCHNAVRDLFQHLADPGGENFDRSPTTFDLAMMVASTEEDTIFLPAMKESTQTLKALIRDDHAEPQEEATLNYGLPEEELDDNQDQLDPVLDEESPAESLSPSEYIRQKNFCRFPKRLHMKKGTVHSGSGILEPAQGNDGGVTLRFALQKPVISGQIYEKHARVEGMDKCRPGKGQLAKIVPLLLSIARQAKGLGVQGVSVEACIVEIKHLWSLVSELVENSRFKTCNGTRLSNRPVRFELFCAANSSPGTAWSLPPGVDLLAGLALHSKSEIGVWDREALSHHFDLPNAIIQAEGVAAGFCSLPPAGVIKVLYSVEVLLTLLDALNGAQGKIISELWKECKRAGSVTQPFVHIPPSCRVMISCGDQQSVGIKSSILKLGGLGPGEESGPLQLPAQVSDFNINFNSVLLFCSSLDRTIMKSYSKKENVAEIDAWQSLIQRLLLEATMSDEELEASAGQSALEEPSWELLSGLPPDARAGLLTRIMKVVVACSFHYTWQSLSGHGVFGSQAEMEEGQSSAPLLFCDFPRCTRSLEEMKAARVGHKFVRSTQHNSHHDIRTTSEPNV